MTYYQKSRLVRSATRAYKKHYRAADTAGEKLERELSRLISRKTLIEPTSLRKVVDLTTQYFQLVNQLPKLVGDLVTVATS